jgi:predicted dehydrogenase
MSKRILIVGLGSAGSRQLRLAKAKFPDSDIKVFRSSEIGNLEEIGHEILRTLKDVTNFRPSMAIICSPSPFHTEIAQFLAEMGTHILIEKPLSNSTAGIKRLITTCKENSLILMTGYNLRYLESLNFFRNCILNSAIGQIHSIRCEVGQFLPEWRPDRDYRTTVTARRELGGGALLELSHEFDYLQWIFGSAYWISAVIGKYSNLEINTEDNAHLVIGFSDEQLGYKTIGNLNIDLYRHDKTRNCVAIGELGTIKWDAVLDRVSIYLAKNSEWEIVFQGKLDIEESYVHQLDEFANASEKITCIGATGIDGLKVLELIDSAWKSSKSRSQIMIKREIIEGVSP